MKRKRRLDKPGGTKVRVHWLRLLEVFHAEKDAKSAAKAAAKAEAEGKQSVGTRLGDGLQADVIHILNNSNGTGIWKWIARRRRPRSMRPRLLAQLPRALLLMRCRFLRLAGVAGNCLC